MDDSEAMKEIFSGIIRDKLRLYRLIAVRILNTPADADDAVQNALIKAWNRRETFRSPEGALAGWISRIVVTESYDLLRKRRREQEKRESFEPDRPGENPNLEKLDRAVESLPDLYRETVQIALLSGASHKEAAILLNCSENTLYQRIRRAKEYLKEEFGRMEHEG